MELIVWISYFIFLFFNKLSVILKVNKWINKLYKGLIDLGANVKQNNININDSN